MPDISMCSHPSCPSRESCYRHEASGTKPSEFRQAYMAFTPNETGSCLSYDPVKNAKKIEADLAASQGRMPKILLELSNAPGIHDI